MRLGSACFLIVFAGNHFASGRRYPCVQFDETDFIVTKHRRCVMFETPLLKSQYCDAYANRIYGFTRDLANTGNCTEQGRTVVCVCQKKCKPKEMPEPYKSLLGRSCSTRSVAVHTPDLIDEAEYFKDYLSYNLYQKFQELKWKQFAELELGDDEHVFEMFKKRAHILTKYNSRNQLKIYGISPHTLAFVLLFWSLLCGLIFFQSLFISGIVMLTTPQDEEKME